ncbi:MAG TPA: hypothetical protein VF820_03905 [Patescibacteria group bacterium]
MVKELNRPDQQAAGRTPVPDAYHRAFTDQGSAIGSNVPAVGGDRRGMSPITKGLLITTDALLLLGGTELAVRGITGHFYPQSLDQWLAGLTHANTHTDNNGNTGGTGNGNEGKSTPTVVTPEISQTQIQAEIDAFHKATGDTYTYRVESTGAVTFVDSTKGVDVAVVNSTITIKTIDANGNVKSTVTTPNLQFIGGTGPDGKQSAGQQLQQKIYDTQELDPTTGKPKTTEHVARNPFDLPAGSKVTIVLLEKYPSAVTYIVDLPNGQTFTLTNSGGTSTLVMTDSTYINPLTMKKYPGAVTLYDQQRATSISTNLSPSFAQGDNRKYYPSGANIESGTYMKDAQGNITINGVPTVDGQPLTGVVYSNDGVAVFPFTVGGLVVGGVTQG